MLPSRLFFDDMLEDLKFDERMKCDIYEENNEYHIEASVPGFTKNDIKIEVDKGNITITAEKNKEESESKKYLRRERSFYGKYQRSFYLGDINEDNIKATFDNGILNVVVPKQEIADTKKTVEIK